ncbi:MAG: ribose-phosphate diphosphokinase, partial [Acidaminococcales bacterium]|nr:ribose-phosphate diphosphokinase [Acidaminococcales bacterium]
MDGLSDKYENLHVFSGTSHPALAREIAAHIGVGVRAAVVQRFNNGEVQVLLGDNVRGKDVFVLQTFSAPVNEMIIELLVMIDAFKRASAGSVTAVIPYYAYNRQDKKIHDRDPIAAKLVANIIVAAGVDRIVTMDLHSGQLEGFFDLPVEHISSEDLLSGHIEKYFGWRSDEITVVSPDMGGVRRARHTAERLKCPLAILDRRRPKPDMAVITDIVGEVKGRIAILIDDSIDTASSIVEGGKALKEAGARDIYACCVHAVLSGDAVDQLNRSDVKEIIVTDTIPLPKEK